MLYSDAAGLSTHCADVDRSANLSVGTQSSGEEVSGSRFMAVKGYILCTKVECVRHASSSALVPCANQPRCGPSRSSLLASEASGGDGIPPCSYYVGSSEWQSRIDSPKIARARAGEISVMLGAVRPRVRWALFYPGKDGIANNTAVLSDNGCRLVMMNPHLLSTGRFGESGPISEKTTTI